MRCCVVWYEFPRVSEERTCSVFYFEDRGGRLIKILVGSSRLHSFTSNNFLYLLNFAVATVPLQGTILEVV
jgi:hypothetical protein